MISYLAVPSYATLVNLFLEKDLHSLNVLYDKDDIPDCWGYFIYDATDYAYESFVYKDSNLTPVNLGHIYTGSLYNVGPKFLDKFTPSLRLSQFHIAKQISGDRIFFTFLNKVKGYQIMYETLDHLIDKNIVSFSTIQINYLKKRFGIVDEIPFKSTATTTFKKLSFGRFGFFCDGISDDELLNKLFPVSYFPSQESELKYLPGLRDSIIVYHATSYTDLGEAIAANDYKSSNSEDFSTGFNACLDPRTVWKYMISDYVFKAKVQGVSQFACLSTQIAEMLTGKQWSLDELLEAQGITQSFFQEGFVFGANSFKVETNLVSKLTPSGLAKLKEKYKGLLYESGRYSLSLVLWKIEGNILPLAIASRRDKKYVPYGQLKVNDPDFTDDSIDSTDDAELFQQLKKSLEVQSNYIIRHNRKEFYKKKFPKLAEKLDEIFDSK